MRSLVAAVAVAVAAVGLTVSEVDSLPIILTIVCRGALPLTLAIAYR